MFAERRAGGNMKDETQTGSSVPVLAVVFAAVMGAVLVGGVVIAVAGAMLFFRAREQQRSALAQQQRMITEATRSRLQAEMERARDEEEQDRANRAAGAKPLAAVGELRSRDVLIRLDADGNIEFEGQTISQDALRLALRKMNDEAAREKTVIIHVDPRCLFKHVSAVIQACEQAGIKDVRVTGAQRTADER